MIDVKSNGDIFITVKGEEFNVEEYFSILDDLRLSGSINMFGAPRWMMNNLDLSKEQAKIVWDSWTMKLHPFFHKHKDLVVI